MSMALILTSTLSTCTKMTCWHKFLDGHVVKQLLNVEANLDDRFDSVGRIFRVDVEVYGNFAHFAFKISTAASKRNVRPNWHDVSSQSQKKVTPGIQEGQIRRAHMNILSSR